MSAAQALAPSVSLKGSPVLLKGGLKRGAAPQQHSIEGPCRGEDVHLSVTEKSHAQTSKHPKTMHLDKSCYHKQQGTRENRGANW